MPNSETSASQNFYDRVLRTVTDQLCKELEVSVDYIEIDAEAIAKEIDSIISEVLKEPDARELVKIKIRETIQAINPQKLAQVIEKKSFWQRFAKLWGNDESS